MKIVISGGTGLIGRALAADLAGDGAEVVVLSRAPEAVTGLPSGVAVRGWDARSSSALPPLLEGAGAVVHLAGAGIGDGRWTAERKRLIRDSRVESSAAMAEALTAPNTPDTLVQATLTARKSAKPWARDTTKLRKDRLAAKTLGHSDLQGLLAIVLDEQIALLRILQD